MFMKHYAPNRCEGCQGGCERERRIEVIVSIKKIGGVGSGQVRVDVNEEFKFLYLKKSGRGGGSG